MQEAGYQNLTGVDPYLEDDRQERNVTLLKRTIHELEGTWDLIMLHHTLEHIPDQLATLTSVARLLSGDGRCLVRIPLVSSYAWEHYRENWVQLDAPRHLFLHSSHSIRLVAEQAGLWLLEVQFDSTELQFTGSELYAQDVPLIDREGRFSPAEVLAYRKRAERLNVEGRGDQAAFLFGRA